MTSLETATRNLKRKFRKVANNAFPELLAIGTGELARGRLDRAIKALDKKLCKAAAQEYRKIVAKAIIENRLSTASQAAVPTTKASYGERTERRVENDDMDDDGDTPKGEAITGEDASDKSRKKAKKERRRAEEAAASAAGARDRLNKAADVDPMITVAKPSLPANPALSRNGTSSWKFRSARTCNAGLARRGRGPLPCTPLQILTVGYLCRPIRRLAGKTTAANRTGQRSRSRTRLTGD